MCKYFLISRQGYYQQLKVKERQILESDRIIKLVQYIRRSNKKMGGKKLYHLLGDQMRCMSTSVGRDKFFDLLRKKSLLIKRRRKYAVTTQSHHRFRVHSNKLISFKAQKPHQAWVSDITYIRTRQGFMYLFLITDVYSRKIIGWELNKSLGIEGAMKALHKAIKQCPDTSRLIHHSDRGLQYCSNVYANKLKLNGIEISMAQAGNCYENAIAERVNGILKAEYGLDETMSNEQEALQVTREGIKSYNEQRPHWSLKLQIPSVVHACLN